MRVPSLARRVLGRGRRGAASTAPEQPLRYVFVVTYGRSGSTLVQGLLNTLPRTLVRGENSLYVLPLYRAFAGVKEMRATHMEHRPRQSFSAFYGLHEVRPGRFVSSTRQLVTTNILGNVARSEVDVVGFKEVTWHLVTPEETEGFFEFLDKAFPGCRYVLNERDLDRVVRSGFWQSQAEDEVLAAIRRVEEIQAFLRATRPERTLDLRYERVTSDDAAIADAELRALAQFVHGSCDQALLASLRETLKTGHGPFPFGESHDRWRARVAKRMERKKAKES